MHSISALFLPPMDDYDTQLAREGEDICRVLDLPTHVRRITWVDRVLWHTFPPDECGFFREEGIFPALMKGRLEPKEWRPIMASYRMFRRIRGNPPLSVIFGSIGALFLLMIVGAGVIAGKFENGLSLALALSILLVSGLALVALRSHGNKRLKLQADLLAARVEGKQEFLRVLRRIEGFGLSDVAGTEGGGFRRYFSGKPNVSERIHNLELFKG